MDSKISVPTDNIYKFMATFGLVVIISSLTLLIYMYQYTNDVIYKNATAIYDIDIGSRSDKDKERRVKLLESEVKIAVTNRDIGKFGFLALFTIGLIISMYGFNKWYAFIQPKHDEILKLQRIKLQGEVNRLRKSSWGK